MGNIIQIIDLNLDLLRY